ncbi:MAG TPA: CHAD domain-containing protein [Streptosporangiaceae bacterium]
MPDQPARGRTPARRPAAPPEIIPPPGSELRFGPAGRPVTMRRTWLDTFDWRLYRAGLTLEQVTGAGVSELRLTGRDGTLLATAPLASSPARPAAVRWPARAGALPPGQLAEQLAPVAGVRALLPVARAASVLRERRVLNADDKTVARLTADQLTVTAARSPAGLASPPGRHSPGLPAAAGGAGPDPVLPERAGPEPDLPGGATPSWPAATLPVRLSVTAVRGYSAQAGRLGAQLLSLPGVQDGADPPLEAVLAAAGRRAGDYSGKVTVRLEPRAPAAAAMAAVYAALLDTLDANVPGTIADIDTEFLHDLRIAVRRTRSALKLTGRVLPQGARARFRPEFKWLGDLTTPTRDLDVYLLGLPAMTAALAGAEPGDLEPFGEHLRHRRARAHRELARGLRSARFARLRRDWRAALDDAAGHPGRKPAVARLAAGSISGVRAQVLEAGAAITPDSPPTSLHDLRKHCKELRYLLEIFASLHDPDQHWRAVRELKDLQDCLGEFQDTDVQRGEIQAFAAAMLEQHQAAAPTLLAMGEIAAGLAVRQRRARAQFADLFARFASPASQARITPLTRTG